MRQLAPCALGPQHRGSDVSVLWLTLRLGSGIVIGHAGFSGCRESLHCKVLRGAGLSGGLYRWLVFAISLQRTAQAERAEQAPYDAYSGAGSRCCADPIGMQTARSP